MSMVYIGVAGLTLSATGMGLSLSGALNPSQPNLAASSAQMVNTEAEMLPEILALQAAAQEGGTALNSGYTVSTDYSALEKQLQNKINAAENSGGGLFGDIAGALNPLDWGSSGNNGVSALKQQLALVQAAQQSGGKVYLNSKGVVVPESQAMANFSGYSTADIQGNIMNQEAKNQLALEQKFDPQFISAALKQEQEANPQGVEARQKMYDLIQQQINNPPESPVADEMERQVQERVNAGSGLTPEEQAQLDSAVNQSTGARGDTAGGVDWSRPLTSGTSGTEREIQNALSGTNWLASGETPEDIQYRAEQQDIANLANFISGKTPESQFRELSGAQTGATPLAPSSYRPSFNGGAAAELGASGALGAYSDAVNQSSPWLTGISGALGLLGTGANIYQNSQRPAA